MGLSENILPFTALNGKLRARSWRGVRFLCYHSVVDVAEPRSIPESIPFISREGFRRHLEFFRANGYRVVSMADALALIEEGRAGTGQFVCLTFDDGRLDNFEFAWTVLREFRYSAHFFVCSSHLNADSSSSDPRFMKVEHLRTILREGGSVGSHSSTHRDLTKLDTETVRRELTDSRKVLQDLLGVPVTTIAYPYAFYDSETINAAREAGYTYGFKANTGTIRALKKDDRFRLSRNMIRSGPDNEGNYTLLQGGLDFARYYSELKRWLSS